MPGTILGMRDIETMRHILSYQGVTNNLRETGKQTK